MARPKAKIAKLLKNAIRYRQKGQLQNAIREYENILKISGDKKLHNTLGDLYQQVGDTKNAKRHYFTLATHKEADGFILQTIAVLKKICRMEPENTEVYAKLAELYLQQGIVAETISMYMTLANLYIKQGLVKRALQVYEKIVGIEPDNLKIVASLAEQYLKEGMRKEAIEKYLLIADKLLKQEEWDKVKKIYNRILELDPGNMRVTKGIGILYYHIGDFENAIKYLNEALDKYPENPDILRDLGEVYISIRDFHQAKDIFEKLILIKKDDVSLRKRLAFLYLNIEERDKAQTHLDLILDTYKSASAVDKIEDLLKKALKIDSYNWYCYNRLLDFYTGKNQLDRKHKLLRKLAERYYEKQMYVQSYEILKELQPQFPNDKAIKLKLRELQGTISKMDRERRQPAEKAADEKHKEEVIMLGDIDIESITAEEEFELPDDMMGSDGGSAQKSVSQEIDEVSIEMDELFGQDDGANEQELMEEELVIDEQDLLAEEESEAEVVDLLVPKGNKSEPVDKIEISENELEQEIDRLEISESQEVPLVIPEGQAVEDLEVDLIADSQMSEYDKEMDDIFGEVAEEDETDAGESVFEHPEEAEAGNDKKSLIKENLTEAEVFLKFGLTDKALRHIEAVIRLDDKNVDALQKLKELHSLENEGQKIISVCVRLADIYTSQGMEAEAMAEYETILKIDPGNQTAKDALSKSMPVEDGGKEYEGMIKELMSEDGGADFEVVEDKAKGEMDVAELMNSFEEDVLFQEDSIAEDLEEASDLFEEVEEEEAQQVEEPIEDLQEIKEEDLSNEEIEIDSALSDDFFELATPDEEEPYDIGEEMSIVTPTDVSSDDQSLNEIFEEFKKGVQEQLSPEDYETHYNLGIAYKEMGLMDEAIGEFEIASKTGKIRSECLSMLGLCYLEKQMYQQSIEYFKNGIDMVEQGSESFYGMLYDLANAYELSKDNERAYVYFEQIRTDMPDFRDTKSRLEQLAESVDREKIDKIKAQKKVDKSKNPQGGKRKISYI